MSKSRKRTNPLSRDESEDNSDLSSSNKGNVMKEEYGKHVVNNFRSSGDESITLEDSEDAHTRSVSVESETEDSDEEDLEFDDDDEDEHSTKQKKVLDVNKPVEVDDDAIEKILAQDLSDPNELKFYVKYKDKSYIHCEWLSEEDLVSRGEGQKVKRFQQKPTPWYSDNDVVNPQYICIDRIIDKTVLDGEVYYLVKWMALPYEQASWEHHNYIDDEVDLERIKEYESHLKSSYPANKSFKRPPLTSFKAMKESKVYKNKNELRKYQLEGLNWLLFCWLKNQGSIIADEMGLGKTVQTVCFLNELFTTYELSGPFLVIAPLSTIAHWEREFKAWTNMNVVVYHGSQTSRQIIYEKELFQIDMKKNKPALNHSFLRFNVLITTYEMAMAGISHLKPIQWRAAILDEAHQLKNKSSKRTEMLKQYNIEHRVLATGTPLQNRLEELFALLTFLEPEKFPSEEEFLSDYGDLQKSEDVSKLQDLLKPLMLRRLKEDVEKTIPIKEETIVEVELTGPQKKYYKAILERNFNFLSKGCKGSNMPNLINTMMELRKCCIHPYLIKGAEDRIIDEAKAYSPEEQFNLMIQASGKLVLLDKLLKKLKENGHKVLIFSQMTKCLDILADYLRGRNYNYERIDGAIRGDMRQAAIDRYSTEENSFVFLLCTRAGGVGINLTAADTVIIFDSDWNPQNDLQAQARCHRIGQKKSVKIYRLIMRNTYEREMFDRAGLKLGLDKAVLQKMSFDNDSQTSSGSKPNLSKKEIEQLLKKGAYGVMMDNDEDAIKFCDEDIDQILERRTQVIVHDNSGNKNSIFSKASFTNNNDVELDDPDFWDKWAKQANLDVDALYTTDSLIIDEPRQRKQIASYTGIDKKGEKQFYSDIDNSSDEDAMGGLKVPRDKKAPRVWSFAERFRLEKFMMIWGMGHLDKFKQHFSFRSVEDLGLVTKQLVFECMEFIKDDEKQLIDCERIFYPLFYGEGHSQIVKEYEEKHKPEDETLPSTGEEINEENNEEGNAGKEENAENIAKPKVLYRPGLSLYPDINPKQYAEYKSFYTNAPPEYKEHMKKKAKYFLQRIYLIHLVRNRINYEEGVYQPYAEINTPKIIGIKPAEWWEKEHDQSLIYGLCKYGYQQFDELKTDPETAFSSHTYLDSNVPIKRKKKSEEDNQDNEVKNEDDVDIEEEVEELDDIEEEELIVEEDEIDEKEKEGDDNIENNHEAMNVDANALPTREWPSKSELSSRLKRLCFAIHRRYQTEIRRGTVIKNNAKNDADRWNKRERSEFTRLLNTYGLPPLIPGQEKEEKEEKKENEMEVDSEPKPPVLKYDWDVFRKFSSSFTKKTDEMMNLYLSQFIEMCKESASKVVKKSAKKKKEEEDEVAKPKVKRNICYTPKPNSLVVELASERSRRLLRRVDLFSSLRNTVLPHPEFETIMSKIKRVQNLPSWWKPIDHDKDLLKAIGKYGLGKVDLYVKDAELEHFYGMEFEVSDPVDSAKNSDDENDDEGKNEEEKHEEDRDSKNEKDEHSVTEKNESEQNALSTKETIGESEGVEGENINSSGKIMWPKEAFILRRLEYLIDLVVKNKGEDGTAKRKRATPTVRKTPAKIAKVMDINNMIDDGGIRGNLKVVSTGYAVPMGHFATGLTAVSPGGPLAIPTGPLSAPISSGIPKLVNSSAMLASPGVGNTSLSMNSMNNASLAMNSMNNASLAMNSMNNTSLSMNSMNNAGLGLHAFSEALGERRFSSPSLKPLKPLSPNYTPNALYSPSYVPSSNGEKEIVDVLEDQPKAKFSFH
jgi:SNF2 family DNA or RNA helicase